MAQSDSVVYAVGRDLAKVLPDDPRPWWRTAHLLKLNLLLLSTMMFASTVGYDNSMMNGLQALVKWQEFMSYPKGAYLGGVVAIQAAGSCVGYPLMSIVARVVLQTAASNPAMFIVSRFFIGAASGFFGSAPILVTETAYPLHRGRLTAGYNTLYYVGSLIAAWTTFGTRNMDSNWSWRIPSLLQIAIPLLMLPAFIACPESPRWLVAVGRASEARKVFVEYHAGGDEKSPLVEFEMAEVEEAIRLEKLANSKTGYSDMIKTRGNRHRLFITVSMGIFAQWDGSGIVSYYLAPVLQSVGIKSVTKQTLINGLLHLWNLILAVSAATMVDRVGRRPLLLFSSFGKLICFVIVTGLSGSFAHTSDSPTGIAVIPMLFVFFGFYDIAWTPLIFSYPAEIWPYQLRSRGMAVVAVSTFAALFFNLFVNPIALSAIGWKFYIVYIIMLVIICITVWIGYPETRGRSLEEMAVIFDGSDAAVPDGTAVISTVELKTGKLRSTSRRLEERAESLLNDRKS